MPEETPHRHICFCGVTVVGATVCAVCAEAMVAALLEAAEAKVTIAEGEAETAAVAS